MDYQSLKIREEIKSKADIVALIGKYVELKKVGVNYVGLCPFHSETSPSFTVSPSKQIFHCFGCKKGGDIFRFWMEYHKVSFSQAIRDLAEEFNVDIKGTFFSDNRDLFEELIKINEMAYEYYRDILINSSEGRPAREYLIKRGLSLDDMNRFGLGYSLDRWSGLVEFLKKKNMDLSKVHQAGLIIEGKERGYYDRFRGRIIFPIQNPRGAVLGFGARVLDESHPKYLNTPESPLFKKGEALYGLNLAYDTIAKKERALVVEGYMDVISLHRYGFRYAVGTLGTSLTRNHLRRLRGIAKEVILLFDSDIAGKKASIRSLPLFINEAMEGRVAELPEGEDPDTFINNEGPDALRNLLEDSTPIWDYYIKNRYRDSELNLRDEIERMEELFSIISEVENEIIRSQYIKKICNGLGIEEKDFKIEYGRWLRKKAWKQRGSDEDALDIRLSDDYYIMDISIHYPRTVERLKKMDAMELVTDPALKTILKGLWNGIEGGRDPANMVEDIPDERWRNRFREILIHGSIIESEELDQAINDFEKKVLKIKFLRSLEDAKKRGNIELIDRLLKTSQFSH